MSFQNPVAERYQEGVYRELFIFNGLKKQSPRHGGEMA
jgi:hypothetical protein